MPIKCVDPATAPTDEPSSISAAVPAAPFERIQLAVVQVLQAGSRNPPLRLVCIADEASALTSFSVLQVKRRGDL